MYGEHQVVSFVEKMLLYRLRCRATQTVDRNGRNCEIRLTAKKSCLRDRSELRTLASLTGTSERVGVGVGVRLHREAITTHIHPPNSFSTISSHTL